MKFNYLFVDHNNGHETTYHPFCSNTVLNQEKVTEWLIEKVPGAARTGTKVGHLLNIMFDKGMDSEWFKCPCCDKEVYSIKKELLGRWKELAGIEFILIEGVDGNY